jgi:hypothetical protein
MVATIHYVSPGEKRSGIRRDYSIFIGKITMGIPNLKNLF